MVATTRRVGSPRQGDGVVTGAADGVGETWKGGDAFVAVDFGACVCCKSLIYDQGSDRSAMLNVIPSRLQAISSPVRPAHLHGNDSTAVAHSAGWSKTQSFPCTLRPKIEPAQYECERIAH